MSQQIWRDIGHWLARLAGDSAVLLAVFGLLGKRWLDGRLQEHDREMAKVRTDLEASMRLLQAAIDKTILVTKVHFETEFEAYKAVFGKLSGAVVFAYAVDKKNTMHGQQTTAEACAKHLQARIEGKN